jgi:hypothetical protein
MISIFFLFVIFIISSWAIYIEYTTATMNLNGPFSFEELIAQTPQHSAPLIIILLTSIIGLLYSLKKQGSKSEKTSAPAPTHNPQESINTGSKQTVKPNKESKISEDAAMLLSLLQQDGRLLDFLSEDIASFNDSQVASASRVVHRGCGNVLKKYFTYSPILDVQEDEEIEFPKDLPPQYIKISGKGAEKIRILHRGWILESSKIPERVIKSEKGFVLAPAEGEPSK